MRLYIMRHADALRSEDWRGEEPARPLTDKGRKHADAAGAGLARLRPGVRAVLSSPYARAYETAVIVARRLGLPAQTTDDLTPGLDLPRLDRALAVRPDADGTLLVGHEPDLSGLIRTLIRHDERNDIEIVMKKAACALILTPTGLPGGARVAELVGACDLAWLHTWQELEVLESETDEVV